MAEKLLLSPVCSYATGVPRPNPSLNRGPQPKYWTAIGASMLVGVVVVVTLAIAGHDHPQGHASLKSLPTAMAQPLIQPSTRHASQSRLSMRPPRKSEGRYRYQSSRLDGHSFAAERDPSAASQHTTHVQIRDSITQVRDSSVPSSSSGSESRDSSDVAPQPSLDRISSLLWVLVPAGVLAGLMAIIQRGRRSVLGVPKHAPMDFQGDALAMMAVAPYNKAALDPQPNLLLTVNWHLQKTCNYKCKFCYAHFADPETVNVDKEAGFQLLNELKEWGAFKVNFAGGEPLLNPHLGEYLKYAKELGLKTSIITNASLMDWSWLLMYAQYVDQVGISCDSIDNAINMELGRGKGDHVEITERAFQQLRQINADLSLNIKLKLNTVVTRQTHSEDWTDFIKRNKVSRWKVFQVLRIEGENDDTFDDLEVSDEQFNAFKARHAGVEQMVTEDNDEMTSSYIMITPDGRFYQNTEGRYTKSRPILNIGIQAALEEVGFNYSKFKSRGGAYEL